MNNNQSFIPSYGSFLILALSASIFYFCGKESGYALMFWIGAGSFTFAALMFLRHNGDLHLRNILACILSFAFAFAFFKLARG
ncbi:MAG: hypothetical protein V4686_01695 [Patescibacteria group bacterium]